MELIKFQILIILVKLNNMVTGIYAGHFDPITLGHLDIIFRSQSFCDNLIVAIGHNSNKKPFFSRSIRLDLIKKSLNEFKNKLNSNFTIEVTSFEGLLIDFAQYLKADILIRGIRSVSDFEYEINLAGINKTLCPKLETVFLPTSPDLAVVSSSMVKEIAKHGADVSKFVSSSVNNAIIEYNVSGT